MGGVTQRKFYGREQTSTSERYTLLQLDKSYQLGSTIDTAPIMSNNRLIRLR